MADRLGCTPQRDSIYYSTLIMWIGCHADSQEYARWFGDDIAVRRGSYLVDGRAAVPAVPAHQYWSGRVLFQRLKDARDAYPNARGHISDSSTRTARRRRCWPNGSACADVQTAVRLPSNASTAADCRRRLRRGDPDRDAGGPARRHDRGASAGVRDRGCGRDGSQPPRWPVRSSSGRRVRRRPDRGARGAVGRRCVGTALQHAPDRHTRLDGPALDALLVALGDFVDLKCPFTLGHSRAVAQLAADAAVTAGLDEEAVTLTRRAAWVHDIGRIGVSNQIWSKSSGLTMAEFERMRLHPYLSERILSRVPGLKDVAAVATNHHECLDGSGYPRGLTARQLTMPDRLLAAR